MCGNGGAGVHPDPFRTDRTSTLHQQQVGNLDANFKKNKAHFSKPFIFHLVGPESLTDALFAQLTG